MKTNAKAEKFGLEGEEKTVWVTGVLVDKGLKQRSRFGRVSFSVSLSRRFSSPCSLLHTR